jgi:hypothetical protein
MNSLNIQVIRSEQRIRVYYSAIHSKQTPPSLLACQWINSTVNKYGIITEIIGVPSITICIFIYTTATRFIIIIIIIIIIIRSLTSQQFG